MSNQLELENIQLVKEVANLKLEIDVLKGKYSQQQEEITYLNQRVQEQMQIMAHQFNITKLLEQRLDSLGNICALLQKQIDELKH